MRTLFARFRKYDKDNSGTIDIDEFYALIEEKRSSFADNVFELIDVDNSGVLDFSEFVQCLGTYCMFGVDDILKFCFYVFDVDKNGYIEEEEMTQLVSALYSGDGGPNSNVKIALKKMDTNADGKIDFEEFKELNKQFPTLFFPAFRLQENMMRTSLGLSWWKKHREALELERIDERKGTERLRLKEAVEREKKLQKEIRRKMGKFQYYAMPWRRVKYYPKEEAEKNAFDKAQEDAKEELAERLRHVHGSSSDEDDEDDGKKKKHKRKKLDKNARKYRAIERRKRAALRRAALMERRPARRAVRDATIKY